MKLTNPCTYRGCATPPTARLQPSTGGSPWYGCPAHRDAMVPALYVGMSGAMSGGAWVTVTELGSRS